MGEKKVAEAYILGVPFGLCGAHHFYLRRKIFGIVYACTLGLFGLGYLYDLIRMRWLVKHANRYGTNRKMVSDGYLMCILGGIFGAHHFYLGNKKLGIFYACTLGVFLIGWIVDLIRMRHLVKDHNEGREGKSLGTAYILGLSPFGIFGAYHYYLDNVQLGLIYTFTFGIFGIGWIVDLFRMHKLVRKAGMDKKSVGTAYIMSVPPFGLFGAYHYYLGNYALGILYTCTLGIFGMGWIVDLFRMKGLVDAANDSTSDHGMTKITAYTLCVSPLGIFGAHHFYLERYLNGGFYIATLGLFGFGWIFDMLRLPVLYQRYAEEDKHKYADEAYIFWFPFGLFGLHQFYLERKKWGILYACTLGCFGFGWIIDGFRLPSLIKDYNDGVQDPDLVPFRICRPKCSMFKCRRFCMNLFTPCESCAKFSLVRSRSESHESSNDAQRSNGHVKDDFDVIKEMYPDEPIQLTDTNHQNIENQNQVNIATIEGSYNSNQSELNHDNKYNENHYNPGLSDGSYPGVDDYGHSDYTNYTDDTSYPPPYASDEYQQDSDNVDAIAKPRNSSFNQAGVTRFSNNTDDMYNQQSQAHQYPDDDTVRNPDDVGVALYYTDQQYSHHDNTDSSVNGQGHDDVSYDVDNPESSISTTYHGGERAQQQQQQQQQPIPPPPPPPPLPQHG